jgi:hypothetical protein
VEIHGKNLDDSKVAIARNRFEKRDSRGQKRYKARLTFDELLGHFANDCMSFTAIGALICEEGITRERVRQIYNQYFRDLLPGKKTGRRRVRICTLKRRAVATSFAKSDFSDDEILGKVAKLATEASCVVERSLVGNEWKKGAFRRILINNSNYAVYIAHARCYSGGGKTPRCRFEISRTVLREVAGIVFVLEVDGFENRVLVIPSRHVTRAVRETGNSLFLYPPLVRHPVVSTKPFILDWNQYENAWPSQQGE